MDKGAAAKRRVNIRDVAWEAGVSIATVSRVLNDSDHPVKPETRERVLQAAARCNYFPNDLARGLLSGRTNTVGVVVPDASNPHYPEVVRGVEDVASRNRSAVIFCNTDHSTEKHEYYMSVLLNKRVDGMIIAGGLPDHERAAAILEHGGTPVVMIGRHEGVGFPSVQADNHQAGELAASHLLDGGHTRVAFISGPPFSTAAADRLNGCRSAFLKHGVAWDDTLVVSGDFREESGHQNARTLLGLRMRPSAIIAANDRMAIGAMAAAVDLGFDVGHDVAVVGFDDIVLARYVRPSLTTVALPAHAMGLQAMNIMLTLIEGGVAPEVTMMGTTLKVRDSSAPRTGLEKTPSWSAGSVPESACGDVVP